MQHALHLSRVLDHSIGLLLLPQHWQLLMRPPPPDNPGAEGEGVLLAGLKDDPRVAANVCWALHNLAEQLEDARDQETNPLSPLFITIARALLQASERSDAGENNLRCSAYEALNTTLQNAAADTRGNVEQLLPVILQRLQDTFALQIVSNDDREAQSELQGLLCGTLQVIVQKLGPNSVPFADRLMQLFLQLCSNKNSSLQEEVLMGIGAVAVGKQPQRAPPGPPGTPRDPPEPPGTLRDPPEPHSRAGADASPALPLPLPAAGCRLPLPLPAAAARATPTPLCASVPPLRTTRPVRSP